LHEFARRSFIFAIDVVMVAGYFFYGLQSPDLALLGPASGGIRFLPAGQAVSLLKGQK